MLVYPHGSRSSSRYAFEQAINSVSAERVFSNGCCGFLFLISAIVFRHIRRTK